MSLKSSKNLVKSTKWCSSKVKKMSLIFRINLSNSRINSIYFSRNFRTIYWETTLTSYSRSGITPFRMRVSLSKTTRFSLGPPFLERATTCRDLVISKRPSREVISFSRVNFRLRGHSTSSLGKSRAFSRQNRAWSQCFRFSTVPRDKAPWKRK